MSIYRTRRVATISFTLILLVAVVFMITKNTYKYPEISYDQEWFITNKGGNLFGMAFVDEEDITGLKQKIKLKSKTKLTPIAQIGNQWFQVETSDGERGFVHFTQLSGSNKVKSVKKIWVYKKIGGDRSDSIASGTSATVIERVRRKLNYKTLDFIKVKFEDGSTRWAFDKDFKKLIFDSIPELNSTYSFSTTISAVRKNILGDSISSIEKQYGPATSIMEIDGVKQAFFSYLTVVDQKKYHKGVTFYLDSNNVADSLKYFAVGSTHFYNRIPLVKQIRGLELTKILNFTFYEDNIPKIQWWQNMDKSSGLFDSVFAWALKWLLIIITVFLFLSIARQLVSPLMQIFTFNSYFSNSTVKLVNFTLLLLATHLFYVYIILIANQWFVVGLIGLFVMGFWHFIHTSNLESNRCPSCYTMYSATDEGTSKGGLSKEVSHESIKQYRGTDTKIEGSRKVKTNYYQMRDKKTTNVYRNYTNHRQCEVCGHEWGVAMAEKVDSYSEYD